MRGSADLLRFDVTGDTLSLVDNIIRAGKHGAILSQQLIAFSRQKYEKDAVQNLNMVVCDIGELHVLGRFGDPPSLVQTVKRNCGVLTGS